MITSILIVFLSKLFDCSFSVLKNVFLIKNRYFLSSLCASASVVFFIYTAQQTGLVAYIAIFFATFLGNYLPPLFVNNLEKDKVFTYDIESDTLERGKEYADKLRELNVAVATVKGYNKNLQPVLRITAYSSSKLISKIIESNIPKEFEKSIYENLNIKE